MPRRVGSRRSSIPLSLLGGAGAFALIGTPSAAQIGTVQEKQKISETEGGFGGDLIPGVNFGRSVAALGDLDGDTIGDIAVGAFLDEEGRGAVWILFMNADGTVKREQKISAMEGDFGGGLDPDDHFGVSLAALGDLDLDGHVDLAVGADQDDEGADTDQGAVWILFLNEHGKVRSKHKISDMSGVLQDLLGPLDQFGASIAAFGDLDDDGIVDLAVGARLNDDANQGAAWILFLNADGTVEGKWKIDDAELGGDLTPGDRFGSSVAALGDYNIDGAPDLVVGAPHSDDGGTDQGAIWILFLNADHTLQAKQKISETMGSFGGTLDLGDQFGDSVAALGDLDGDMIVDLAVGADQDGDGGISKGAVWILFLSPAGTVLSWQKINATEGGLGNVLDQDDQFGISVAWLGDGTLAVGAYQDDDGGPEKGAVWNLCLEGLDTTSPTISCPPVVSVIDPKSSTPGETVFFSVTASDDSDPAPSVTCVPPSGSFFPRGTTIVTCTAIDASCNQAICVFPVVVMPTIRERRL